MSAEHVNLRAFDWLIAVAASTLPPAVKRTAMTLPGRTGAGAGLTGRRVQPIPDVTAAMLDLSVRAVERHIEQLATDRYLQRTRKAAPGQPAEYILRGPAKYERAARKTSWTPDTTTRDRDGRSSDTTPRNRVGRSDHPAGASSDTPTRESVGRRRRTPDISGGERPTRPRLNLAGLEQPEQPPPPTTEDLTPARPREAPEVEAVADTLNRIHTRTGVNLTGVAAEVAARLNAGWTPEDLTHALTAETLDGSRSRTAVLRTRLTQLGPAPYRRPPWCGQCHEHTRLLDDDHGVRPCPTCSPQAVTR